MQGTQRAETGFSLLEAILALGLVSLVVLFSSNFLITVIQANALSQNRTAALALAQEKIEDWKGRPAPAPGLESEINITNGSLATFFSRETSVVRNGSDAALRIAVRVTWPRREGAGDHQVALSSKLAE